MLFVSKIKCFSFGVPCLSPHSQLLARHLIIDEKKIDHAHFHTEVEGNSADYAC
jgi:hypothetical protein